MAQGTLFFSRIHTAAGINPVRRLYYSLRTFGGSLSDSPFWVFCPNPGSSTWHLLLEDGIQLYPLEVEPPLEEYALGDKAAACARAEEMAPAGVQTLVWIDPTCLIIQPPRLYELDAQVDIALRPVHIQNIGLLATSPLDDYWAQIYRAVGIHDTEGRVESFQDCQILRAYYNTHAFSIRPALGLLRRWKQVFSSLVADPAFQKGPCGEEEHCIYLHQAVLSALIVASLPAERIRGLPPDYNYPVHLHDLLPPDRQAHSMNELTSLAYDDWVFNPMDTGGIRILEPLRTWLIEPLPGE